MPREKEGYRDNFERINALVPNKECLTKADVRRITGWCYNTMAKRLKFNRFGEITKSDFCRQISA